MRALASIVSALALAALALSACAGVPLAPRERDAAAKRFEPAPPGLAALYIVREGSLVTSPTRVLVDQRAVGALGYDTYLRMELPPGLHVVRALDGETGQQLAVTNIQLEIGDIRFVALANAVLDAPLTRSVTEMAAREMPNAQGRTAVRAKSLAAQP
jgi:hypothetical protein